MFRRFSIGWLKFWMAGDDTAHRAARALFLSSLTGILSGFAAVAFHWLLDALRFLLSESLAGTQTILAAGEHPLFHAVTTPRPWVLLLLPAAGALISALIVKFFSPESAGHGTDACIHAFHQEAGVVKARVIPVKAITSALVIGSGGSAGCEGPITQIGSACGSLVARVFRLNATERRILMVAGLAAGVGAIFRAPLAGAIFGAEILYSGLDLEYEVVIPSIVASTFAYAIFCIFYGWQTFFIMPECSFNDARQLLLFFALALIIAFGAKLYILVFRQTESVFRNSHLPSWARPAIGGLLTGGIVFFLPEVSGAGYGLIQTALEVGNHTGHALSFGLLLAIFLCKIFATSFTVGSGGSGGLFGPALVAGSALGAAVGLGFSSIAPEWGTNPGAFALVGMAGFLAATVRTPLAAIVMVSEISGNHALLLPTMWVCGITYWICGGWTIYRSQVRARDCSAAHANEYR